MIEEVGFFGPVEPDDLPQRTQMTQNTAAAPAPAERMQREALRLDRLAVFAHPRRNRHSEAGIARRPRHRQAVRAEIPILGDEKEQLWRGHAAFASKVGLQWRFP